MEFIEKGLSKSPNFKHLSRTIGPTNLLDMTPLTASGLLQNATKYCTSVQNGSGRTKSRITRPLFNLESPRLAGTSAPTYSKPTPDMTSQVASSRHISKFEMRHKMLNPSALSPLSLMQCQRRFRIKLRGVLPCPNFGWAFCLVNQLSVFARPPRIR